MLAHRWILFLHFIMSGSVEYPTTLCPKGENEKPLGLCGVQTQPGRLLSECSRTHYAISSQARPSNVLRSPFFEIVFVRKVWCWSNFTAGIFRIFPEKRRANFFSPKVSARFEAPLAPNFVLACNVTQGTESLFFKSGPFPASFWIYFFLFCCYTVRLQVINFTLINYDRKQERRRKSIHSCSAPYLKKPSTQQESIDSIFWTEKALDKLHWHHDIWSSDNEPKDVLMK